MSVIMRASAPGTSLEFSWKYRVTTAPLGEMADVKPENKERGDSSYASVLRNKEWYDMVNIK